MKNSKTNSHDVFLSDENVDLIILNENLAKNSDWYKWLNDKKITKFTNTGIFPNTSFEQLKYFKEKMASTKIIKKFEKTDRRIQLGIINSYSKKFVGVISLFRFDYIGRSCSISMLIDQKLNTKNSLRVVRSAQSLMIDHAFERLNFRRIFVQTFSKELSNITQKLWGFKLEGIFREKEYSDGKYHDAYALGLLKREWLLFKSKSKN